MHGSPRRGDVSRVDQHARPEALVTNLEEILTVGAENRRAGRDIRADITGETQAQGRASISLISSSLMDLKRPASASMIGLAI